MALQIFADLIGTNREIEKKVLDRLAVLFNAAFYRMQRSTSQKIRPIVRDALVKQPEYDSLINGILLAEFGLVNAKVKVDAIIDKWVRGVSVELTQVRNTGKTLRGGIDISMIIESFADVLEMAAARQFTEVGGFHSSNPQELPWLQWLLKEGDKVIIKGWDVQFGGKIQEFSRTGLAIMRKGKIKQWSVPEQFKGTIHDNWVTRAINTINEGVLLKIFEEEVYAKI